MSTDFTRIDFTRPFALSESVPEVLYHYCPAEAFKSIIESKSLWLTDSECMNDYTENKLFLEYIRRALEELLNEVTDIEEKKRKTDIANQFFGTIIANCSQVLVASLSELKDDLSQWRGYAEEGFAIGFNTHEMKLRNTSPHTTVGRAEYSIGLIKILYIPDDKGSQDNLVAKLKQSIDLDLNISELMTLAIALTHFRFSTKNFAYSQEREWRIAHTPLIKAYYHGYIGKNSPTESSINQLKFRNTRFGLAPYCEWPFPICEQKEEYSAPQELGVPAPYPPQKPSFLCNVVNEVIIGPKNKSHQHSITHFLQHNGFFIKPERVTYSGRPYR